MSKLKLVETEPDGLFDHLWREFPQLKNATCVGRCAHGWRNDDGSWDSRITRTFRTLEGKYVRITSTSNGNKLGVPPVEEVEIYEDVWKQLGHRALGEPHDEPHGIIFASDQFFEQTEDRIEFQLRAL